jgi:hypothetical protein
MKVNKGQLIIDVSCIDQSSYEALVDFAEENKELEIGKLVRQWIDNTLWDVAAWYIGYDL